ncbi:Acg family FMN-binding oxidoreductase [Nocardioides sp.]|uniref:Acg family FMN-binding oxidoreductase n=1 Tax=Nocardioides sp. TaxID=35761 RepID=UPI003784B683
MTTRSDISPTSTDTARDLVAFACQAPSIHNSQPWRWRAGRGRLELRADRDRQLSVADPEGRHLTISCGAALHHAVVRARALGLTCDVTLVPDAGDPDLLATVRLFPGRPDPLAQDEADLLGRRRTDRRRFTAWPLPEDRLAELVDAVDEAGTTITPVREQSRRVRVGLLVTKALFVESTDPDYAAEQARWAEPTPDGGVPETHRPVPHRRLTVSSRYDDTASAPARDAVAPTDGLLVVTTPGDGPVDWLRTGIALCKLWTGAMDAGMSVVPLSQVVEVPETRSALSEEIGEHGHPQLLLRLGWQEIARNPLPPSGRRPVEEVLVR